MNDTVASEISRVKKAADKCSEVLSLRGYGKIDTPILEETELFLRKSGGELSSRLYDFEEPGGFRTSLRPEFTAPVIRYAIENGEALNSVCRYQYFGPVFRYATPEHSDGTKTRQFNQLGAELIGVPAPRGDGEIIAMALDGLKAIDVSSVTIAVGHVGLLRQLLKKFMLSERASQFLLSNVGRIAAGRADDVAADAQTLGFLGDDSKPIADVPGSRDQIEAVLERSLAPLGANAGSRTRQEVIARLARKQTYADDPERFRSALSMFTELTSITGDVDQTLEEGRKLAATSGLDEGCFALIESVVEAAQDEGVAGESISIRYGLARGVAYYTGMLFDILPDPDANESMGGGGRYDGLTRALGLDEVVPALGFAYNFDAVMKLTPTDLGSAQQNQTTLVRARTPEAWKAAVTTANELRTRGIAAVLDTGDRTTQGDFSEIVTVDSGGQRTVETFGAGS